jgi:hypothetical protein
MQDAAGGVIVSKRRDIVTTPMDEAFSALTQRHVDAAYRLAWAILGNDGDAEDAIQDAADTMPTAYVTKDGGRTWQPAF